MPTLMWFMKHASIHTCCLSLHWTCSLDHTSWNPRPQRENCVGASEMVSPSSLFCRPSRRPPRPCASEPSKQARPQKDQGSADEYPTKRSAWTAFKWGLLIKRDSLKTITETLVTDTVTFQLNVLYRNFNQLLSDFDVKNKLYSGGVLELISLAFPQSFPHLLRSEMFFRQMQEGKDPRSIHPVS